MQILRTDHVVAGCDACDVLVDGRFGIKNCRRTTSLTLSCDRYQHTARLNLRKMTLAQCKVGNELICLHDGAMVNT